MPVKSAGHTKMPLLIFINIDSVVNMGFYDNVLVHKML